MQSRLLRPFAIGLLLSATTGTAHAEPILDQVFDPRPSPRLISVVGDDGFEKAQTFTVGLPGVLTRVDVLISRGTAGPSDLLFDIRRTSGGVPVDAETSILAAVAVPASQIPAALEFVSIDLSAFNLVVSPGDHLAIALRTGLRTSYWWYGSVDDPYLSGAHYFRSRSVTSWTPTHPLYDVGFRSFVDSSVIPEPPNISLTTLGFILWFAFSRRRRRGQMAARCCEDHSDRTPREPMAATRGPNGTSRPFDGPLDLTQPLDGISAVPATAAARTAKVPPA